jgi:ribosomal protein L35
VTGTGKLTRRSQMSGKLMHKSPKQKRQFSKDKPVAAAVTKKVNRLLGRA